MNYIEMMCEIIDHNDAINAQTAQLINDAKKRIAKKNEQIAMLEKYIAKFQNNK